MAADGKVRVGVLGAGGRWAMTAHLPAWRRDRRVELVAVCDVSPELAEQAARQFEAPVVTTDYRELLDRDDIDVIDVCTPSRTHFPLAWDALQAGKHVLCEKPVANDFRDTLRAADLADRKGLRTKLGFTFRYSPAMMYMRELVDQGYIGQPFIFNGYEQNSQWLDPQTPLRQVDPDADPGVLHVSSLEGYGAPIIDIGHWLVGADYTAVVGTMRNFIPMRMVRDTGRMMRMNIDDGTIYLAEYANGAIGTIQTSYVTVGNYPGIEARLYGSQGALICRMVEEFGVAETLRGAKPDAVEFRELEVPARFYPERGHPREGWRTLFYSNLVRTFVDEILDPSLPNQGNFRDGAWVQEAINAVELSFRERRWVSLPLPR